MTAQEGIKKLLTVYGWSQNKLAPRLGMSQPNLSRIIAGHVKRVDYRAADRIREMLANKERP